jgi:hypothetical protein
MIVAILAFWVLMTQDLFRRDLLPAWIVGPPPDLRSLATASDQGSATWAMLVVDPRTGQADRTVGEVTTEALRRRDRSLRLSSVARFEAGSLLRGTPFGAVQDARLEVVGNCEVDPTGDLSVFRVTLREQTVPPTELVTMEGRLKGNRVVVTTESPLEILQGHHEFTYHSRGLVQNSFAPFDRMPGLRVGQRWESRVVNPLNGRVESGTVEVAAWRHITWNDNPVPVHEVVTRMGALTARTWVRGDGLVLRQEVPLLFVRLWLDRQPDATTARRGRP